MNSAMDGFRLNKILGLVLGTLLVLQTLRIVDGAFLPAKEHSRVAVAEAKGEAATGALDNLLASASAERGAQLAKVCQACHNVEEGQGRQMDLRRAQQVADRSARRRSRHVHDLRRRVKREAARRLDRLSRYTLEEPRAAAEGSIRPKLGIGFCDYLRLAHALQTRSRTKR